MHFNLFNMIQSIAAVIFTAMQIIQSLAMWNIFKLAFKLLWLNSSSLISGLPKCFRLILDTSVPMWNQSVLHGAWLF